MDENENISRAQEILSQIAIKCHSILDIESRMDLLHPGAQIVDSEDLNQYTEMINDFLKNIMNVPVESIIDSGFMCRYDACNTKFFLGKKRVLAFMIHILQDIVLFRNKLKIEEYVSLFGHIINKEVLDGFIKAIVNGEKDRKARINKVDGKIKQLNSSATNELSELTSTLNEMVRQNDLKEKSLKELRKQSSKAGISANACKQEIEGKSFQEMRDMIGRKLPDEEQPLREIGVILRQIVYLRNLDNLCNVIKKREDGVPEIEIQEGINIHIGWITEVLEIVLRTIEI